MRFPFFRKRWQLFSSFQSIISIVKILATFFIHNVYKTRRFVNLIVEDRIVKINSSFTPATIAPQSAHKIYVCDHSKIQWRMNNVRLFVLQLVKFTTDRWGEVLIYGHYTKIYTYVEIRIFSQFDLKMWTRPSKYVISGGTLIWALLRNIEKFCEEFFTPLEAKVQNIGSINWTMWPWIWRQLKSVNAFIWGLQQNVGPY